MLSGGLDSTVSLILARKNGLNIPLALTFDYGQAAVHQEIKAARAICKVLNINHQVIKLPWLAEIVREKTPHISSPGYIPRSRICAGWIPNRNGLFINIAAVFAEALKYQYIVTGFNREEAVSFPDNSIQFIRSINRALALATLTGVEVISYTVRMNKAEIIKKGWALGAPLDLTWSCYQGGKSPCGKCESCLRRIRACLTADRPKES